MILTINRYVFFFPESLQSEYGKFATWRCMNQLKRQRYGRQIERKEINHKTPLWFALSVHTRGQMCLTDEALLF